MGERDRVYVGVLRVRARIPGARSRKDRRRPVRSLCDRMRHRFELSVHEIDRGDDPRIAVIAAATVGNDGARIRAILDRAADLARSDGSLVVVGIDVDVFRWHAPGVDDRDPEAFHG